MILVLSGGCGTWVVSYNISEVEEWLATDSFTSSKSTLNNALKKKFIGVFQVLVSTRLYGSPMSNTNRSASNRIVTAEAEPLGRSRVAFASDDNKT